MRLARRVFFLLTCFQAYVSCAAGLMVVTSVLPSKALELPPVRIIFSLLATVFFFAAIINAITAWRMQKGPTRWMWAASILNLVVFPLGTLLGIGGLGLLSRKSFRDFDPAPPLRPVVARVSMPGDGASEWTKRLFSTVPLAVAIAIMWAAWQWADANDLPSRPLWVWITLGELAFLTSTLIHECGHLVCGWLSEFRLMSFLVGPFHFRKRGGRWGFRFVAKSILAGGGHCGMIPIHLRRIQSRGVFFTAGGPLGSLLVALACTAAFLTSAHAPWRDAWPFFQTAMVAGWASLVANLIPVPTAEGYSDGARMRQYRKEGWCDQLLARGLVTLSLQTDLRPRDWDTDIIERAANFDNGLRERLLFFLLCYEMHSDRGNHTEAARWMRQAMEASGGPDAAPSWAKKFAPHFAFHEAYEKGDTAAGRQWLAGAAKEDTADWHRAKAAVLCGEGHIEAARAAWHAASKAASKLPTCGGYSRDRELVEAMRTRLFEAPQPLQAAA